MLIACYAIGASVGYNYLRGEFIGDQWKVVNTSIKEAYERKLIGENILDSGVTIDIVPLIGAGAYIVGEETAMLESIEGKKEECLELNHLSLRFKDCMVNRLLLITQRH